MKNTPYLFALLALCVPFILSGCWAAVGAGAGASTVAYIDGSVKDNLDATVEVAHAAVLKAMDNLKFKTTSDSMDATQAEVIARDSKDEKIKINLERITDATTKVSVRVGIFGDQAVSVDILEQIKKSLK